MKNLKEQVINYVKKTGIVSPKNLKKVRAPKSYLSLLHKEGIVEKLGRGIYAHIEYEFDEKQSLLEVCKRVPKGIICLLSALRYHEFTTQNPYQVWLAIDNKSWAPRIEYPPIRLVRFSGKALSEGVEVMERHGVKIKVYNPAKTVVDCFKYRNKIGLDVAIEALRDGWRKKLFTMQELNYYAKVCRVQNVMQPYIESIL